MNSREITRRIDRLESIMAGLRQDAGRYVDGRQPQLIRYGEELFSSALHLETAVAQLRAYAKLPAERR